MRVTELLSQFKNGDHGIGIARNFVENFAIELECERQVVQVTVGSC